MDLDLFWRNGSGSGSFLQKWIWISIGSGSENFENGSSENPKDPKIKTYFFESRTLDSSRLRHTPQHFQVKTMMNDCFKLVFEFCMNSMIAHSSNNVAIVGGSEWWIFSNFHRLMGSKSVMLLQNISSLWLIFDFVKNNEFLNFFLE